QDDLRMAIVQPLKFVSADTMEEAKHRIFLAGRKARGRVNDGTAFSADSCRSIVDGVYVSLGNITPPDIEPLWHIEILSYRMLRKQQSENRTEASDLFH